MVPGLGAPPAQAEPRPGPARAASRDQVVNSWSLVEVLQDFEML